MTTRIISAAEAQTLLEDSTPGPWEIEDRPRECQVYISTEHGEPRLQYTGWSGFISVYGSKDLPRVGQIVANANAALVAAAPDLAASVVALHALLAREKDHTKQLQTLLDEAYDFLNAGGEPAWDDWCDRLCKIDFEVMP